MFEAEPAMLLVALIGAHCFFDYAGQGDFMSKAKNPANPIPGVPWVPVMLAHAAIHGAAVALLTGLWWLFLLEAAIHFTTDVSKCWGEITYAQDQLVHVLCKVAWVAVVTAL